MGECVEHLLIEWEAGEKIVEDLGGNCLGLFFPWKNPATGCLRKLNYEAAGDEVDAYAQRGEGWQREATAPKINLAIFWLKDEALEESANLPDPGVISLDIIETCRLRWNYPPSWRWT